MVSDSRQGSLHGVSEEFIQDEEVLPEFSYLRDFEAVDWDLETAGHSTLGHTLESFRDQLKARGLPSAEELVKGRDGSRVSYAGLVICRQRPGTAKGVMFVTLEDETGFANLIVCEKVFQQFRTILLTTSFLGVTGKLQCNGNIVHIIVEECWLPLSRQSTVPIKSRDFR